MKGLIKRVLRTFWIASSPVRRPFVRRLDSYLDNKLSSAFETNVNPVLDSLIREVARLEMQIEILQHSTQKHD